MSVPSILDRPDGERARILIVSSWYPGAASEVSGVFVADQAQILARKFDVSVYVPQFFSLRNFLPGGALPQNGLERRREIPVRRGLAFMPPFCTRFAWTLRAALRHASRKLCKAIGERGRPSIIHAHVAFPAGWIAVRAGVELGIPVVLTEHSGPFSKLVSYAPQRPLVHEALSCAQRVIAVSPALADQVKSEFPDVEVGVMGNVVRTDLFTLSEERPAPKVATIAAVALLTENKGLDVLIEAIALLSNRDAASTQLVIAGDGPDRPRLEKLARARGVHERCRFAGMLSREAVAQLLRQCDVFVLPSFGETFGLVLAEAMACGKPVIATRCGGPEFLVTAQTGILVPTRDAGALANALTAVLTGAWRPVPQNSRREIETRFGPDAFLRNIAIVYEDALATASRRGDGKALH